MKNVQVLFVVTLEDDVEARYGEGLIVGLVIFKPLAKYFTLRNLNNVYLTKRELCQKNKTEKLIDSNCICKYRLYDTSQAARQH